MVDLDLAFSPAGQIARRVASRELSPVEVVANSLARIDQVNPKLNCFAFVWHDEATRAAESAAQAIARGEAVGPLHGVPGALKDTTPTAGHRTTLGSYTHEHWVPERAAYNVGARRRSGGGRGPGRRGYPLDPESARPDRAGFVVGRRAAAGIEYRSGLCDG